MRKIFTACSIVMLTCFLAVTTFAQTAIDVNQLIGVKVLPLPDNRVRLIFQFQSPLTHKPTGFVMKKPAMLVFDFINTAQKLPSDKTSAKVRVGVLNNYSLIYCLYCFPPSGGVVWDLQRF